MKEASTWRYALAQKIAWHYHANPKVAAVLLEGSVARQYADYSSDLDLGIFWAEPPTAKERRDIVKHVEGQGLQRFPYNREEARWSEEFEVAGVTIDVRHTTVKTIEGILADVLEHAESSLPRQQRLAALLSARPLANPELVTQWQQQAAGYPHDLRVRMVRAYVRFRPAWEQEKLAKRNDVLVLYDSFCTTQKHILLVLMALNGMYFPGFQWIDRTIEQMQVVPPDLSSRLKQIFAIVAIDPLAAVYQLHELVEETFALVESHLIDVDTRQARERFQLRREIWEHAPDDLL